MLYHSFTLNVSNAFYNRIYEKYFKKCRNVLSLFLKETLFGEVLKRLLQNHSMYIIYVGDRHMHNLLAFILKK